MSDSMSDAAESTENVVSTGGMPIPRISIHAFMNRADNRNNLSNACKDRRMAKVTCEIHEGDIATATEHFKDAPTPNLLFVEVPETPQQIISSLQGLAEVCDPGTQVVLIGGLNDISTYREFMRQGISEYLVSPVGTVQYIETLAVLYADPATQPKAKLHCFVGAKGGVGSSLISHNVAWCISEKLNESTIILDLDLSFGTSGLDFNLDSSGRGIIEALLEPNRLDDVLLNRLIAKPTDRLALFIAPSSLEDGFDPPIKSLEKILEVVRANYAHVVIDLPHIWNNWARTLLTMSDEVILTVTPDLVCLRNGKNIFDYLIAQRPNDTKPRVILNMTESPKRPEIPVKEFTDALGVPPTAILTHDNALFGAASNNGQMLGEVDPKNKNSETMMTLASMLTKRNVALNTEVKSKSPFAPLLALLKGQKA